MGRATVDTLFAGERKNPLDLRVIWGKEEISFSFSFTLVYIRTRPEGPIPRRHDQTVSEADRMKVIETPT